MLTDLERKVLRILYNFPHSIKKRMPTIRELEIKTGKDEKTVRSVLNGLVRGGYIECKDGNTQNIKIISTRDYDSPFK
ncbi:BlaI/MecI/CopY family transcriptional regulator [Chengkuizengella sediminis]|uniref:BlaI/MecI/CopY family transcriptional regulator n=1 Tax=Chengkuizengella sediminis TaxID=1885917 RepID=UPI00138A1097|nr:BlaI/MecI/CopY family transcriptional regulator [Chengkuizengella sediminis]NDI34544.1 BlaI/MecI/CopY family transcriptional regulator [Chengkuizengella sediminis]